MLVVDRTGAQALLQDLGRAGHAHLGVSPSGAADRAALRLANRLVAPGTALAAACALAAELARLPQDCLRSDRLSVYEQWPLDLEAALRNETRRGLEVLVSEEMQAGLRAFMSGRGRHGASGE